MPAIDQTQARDMATTQPRLEEPSPGKRRGINPHEPCQVPGKVAGVVCLSHFLLSSATTCLSTI